MQVPQVAATAAINVHGLQVLDSWDSDDEGIAVVVEAELVGE